MAGWAMIVGVKGAILYCTVISCVSELDGSDAGVPCVQASESELQVEAHRAAELAGRALSMVCRVY